MLQTFTRNNKHSSNTYRCSTSELTHPTAPHILLTHLAGVSLDDDVATLADLAGFRGDGVRRTGVGAGEVVVVQLVLGGHG